MSDRDRWSRRAHAEGLRSRSAYKLRQLDDRFDVLDGVERVVDLGSAPGGWLQVAARSMDPGGTVVAVDRRSVDPLEDVDVEVIRIRGDVTEEETRRRIRSAVDGSVDLVLSDMAPNMSGEYELDHARSVHLAREAAETAHAILAPGGDLVVKVFDGRDLDGLVADLEREFDHVARYRPEATRQSSSEVYLLGRGRLTAPVRSGDRLEAKIVDTGSEGDGVAKVDDYTVFVPDAEVGESVTVEIVDVKPRFAFARRLD